MSLDIDYHRLQKNSWVEENKLKFCRTRLCPTENLKPTYRMDVAIAKSCIPSVAMTLQASRGYFSIVELGIGIFYPLKSKSVAMMDCFMLNRRKKKSAS
jgi:hypothetical protein